LLTVEDERLVEETAARLSERKSRKIALAKYPVETLKRVKSMLVQQVPMATICKLCGVPSSVVIKLQKDFNPRLRKRFHLQLTKTMSLQKPDISQWAIDALFYVLKPRVIITLVIIIFITDYILRIPT